MTDSTVGTAYAAPRGRVAAVRWKNLETRRRLQLGLGLVWLVDAILQFQSFMFTKAFSQTLTATAAGNPRVIADPITWSARIVADHPVSTNAAFAAIQLLLALGILWRPTVKAALAASVAWSLAVWWFGEGLGGVLNGSASTPSGAPGAVILYALLAVLLWPADDGDGRRPQLFVAERPVGARVSRLLWLVLWGSLAYLTIEPATNRSPQGLHDMVAGMGAGEPGWLGSLERGGAAPLAHQGLAAAIVLGALLAVVAIGVFLPPPAMRATLILAVVLAAVIWVFGEAFGALLTGQGTDVNSGPLLALIAAVYWPHVRRATRSGDDVVIGPESRVAHQA